MQFLGAEVIVVEWSVEDVERPLFPSVSRLSPSPFMYISFTPDAKDCHFFSLAPTQQL